MISKLPRWVWAAAGVLAFIAGMVNVVGLLGFEHEAITHLTGTTTLLGAALAAGERSRALHFLSLIGAFVAGCAISGFVVQDSTLLLGRRYGVALALCSALLFVAVALLEHGSALGLYAAACACGVQNAMVSTYSGAVVRTTHLSGMFTDLGIFLGHYARALPVHARRLTLCLTVIAGFLLGGFAGALAFEAVHTRALLFPAVLAAMISLVYVSSRIRSGRRPPSR